MPSEVDINLIFLRLGKFEERIKVLEADVKNLKSDDYYQVKAGPATKPKWPIPQWEEDLK